MTTSGLRVVRFRKRYYSYSYQPAHSYPRGLGKDVADEIPKDAVEYQRWLADRRKYAKKWEALYKAFLSVKPGNILTADVYDFMDDVIPSSLPPVVNDIDYIYTVDLDRETFSVNNGAHFKLEQIPHIDWIESLADGGLGDQISLPGAVPMEAVTHLVVEPKSQSSELSNTLCDLPVSDTGAAILEIVVPKDLRDIPWRQRHGPTTRAIMFQSWSQAQEDLLAATLLQLDPEDLPFREFAYAALCLAAGGKNINVVPSGNVKTNGIFGFIDKNPEYNTDSDFFSLLASGGHLEGCSPASSPKATIYWLDNVLVFLTAQLYRTGAVDQGIARLIRYCQDNHPAECVDAVLISVEHVVLIHVIPGEKVQHTAIMPLFNIENHLTMAVSDRYANRYLEELAVKDGKFTKKEAEKMRKINQESMLKNEGAHMYYRDEDDEEGDLDEEEEAALCVTQVEGNTISTFYALVHLFEAAACKRMPQASISEGRLPNELYMEIIKLVTDTKTRNSLMEVSRIFRRTCQENLLFADSLIIEPSETCQRCDDANCFPAWYAMYDTDTGNQSQLKMKQSSSIFNRGNAPWEVIIGTEHSKKSLLAEARFSFYEV